jgi:hypothetical protein
MVRQGSGRTPRRSGAPCHLALAVLTASLRCRVLTVHYLLLGSDVFWLYIVGLRRRQGAAAVRRRRRR